MFLGLSGVQKIGESGGYECKIFVSTPLDRYFCVICQRPSRDPRMSVCCGRGVRHQLESRTSCLESQMESGILPWNPESCG